MSIKRDLIQNAPTLLHSVALVEPTLQDTVANIRRMFAGLPPNLYGPARQLVHLVLRGQSADWAEGQVHTIQDPRQQKCAADVLRLSAPYFELVRPVWFRPLDLEFFQLGELQIPVRFDGVMNFGNGFRVFLMNPWQKRLSAQQTRAALTILRAIVARRQELKDASLDFLDLSVSPITSAREYRLHGWDSYRPMSEDELAAFSGMFSAAWKKYHEETQSEKPRSARRVPDEQDLFGQDEK